MRFYLKRRILGLYGNQAEFAKACGRNDNWISRIIMGRQNPTKDERKLIIEKLHAQDLGDFLFIECEARK